MILKIDDYITMNDKKELYADALDFAKKKQQGVIVCRVLKFEETDTPEQTQQKLKQHALWRYVGNVAQKCFINYIIEQVGDIQHDIMYTTKKGHKGDIDTLTSNGLRGDIKSSQTSKYLNVNYSDLKNNDIFIKVYIDPINKTFEICGFTTKKFIYDNIKEHYGLYRVEYNQLNHNINELIDLYR